MEHTNKRGRGLEEVAHLFLSHQSPPNKAKKLTAKADTGEFTPLPDSPRKKQREEAVSTVRVTQNACLLFSANSLFAEQPFLVCNLALELARRGFSVGLIETATTVPNTLFLLESFFPTSMDTESAYPFTDKAYPALERSRLLDIAVGNSNKIKAVFLDRNIDSADCLTLLNKLRNESQFLIINAPANVVEFNKLTAFMNPFFIVPVTVNSKALSESHLLIKHIFDATLSQKIGLLMIEENRSHKAETAFNVVAERVRKLLSTDIYFMGTIPRGTDIARPVLTRTPLLLEAGNSPVFQAIRKLTDRVIKEYPPLKSQRKN